MTQLETVRYTANTHATGDRDGASNSENSRLDVKPYSPCASHPEVNRSLITKLVFQGQRMITSTVSPSPIRLSCRLTHLRPCPTLRPSYAQTVPAGK
jgi:hypothetical protein